MHGQLAMERCCSVLCSGILVQNDPRRGVSCCVLEAQREHIEELGRYIESSVAAIERRAEA